MTDFKFAGYEVYHGASTAKWEYRYLAFGLMNAHTIWVTTADPPRPVRYEMKGYDNLLASYYDNYVLEYISFEEWKPDLDRFELPKGSECYNLSHSFDRHFVSNPMQEFMSYGKVDFAIERMYRKYQGQHNKQYDSEHEVSKRKHIFRHNMRYIRSINRKNLKYKLAPNHFVDLTDGEYDQHKGIKPDTSTNHTGGVPLQPHHRKYSNMSHVLQRVDVPDELDWRDYGAVSPVRGQGICGSCYALAAVGAVEGAYFMKTGKLKELSAQQVIDCSWGSGNRGCKGGYYNKAMSWIYLHGIASAESYGPYLGQEGTCRIEGLRRAAAIDAFAFVPKYNNTALKISVARFGPAVVSINENPLSLKFYSWGLYDDPECDSSSSVHSVLVVGYGVEDGEPYWLVKNSWSTTWGMDGYIKIAWKRNTCGVTRNPVVALIKHTTFHFPSQERSTKKAKTATAKNHERAWHRYKPNGAEIKALNSIPQGSQNMLLVDSESLQDLKHMQHHFNRELNVRKFTSRAARLRYERKRKRKQAAKQATRDSTDAAKQATRDSTDVVKQATRDSTGTTVAVKPQPTGFAKKHKQTTHSNKENTEKNVEIQTTGLPHIDTTKANFGETPLLAEQMSATKLPTTTSGDKSRQENASHAGPPTEEPSPLKPFAGKLQDIYENLNKLIETSVHWKNREHALRYSHES
ncbi:counting factor associated protein D isoform X4 [Nematostella vectensis]|nr:counting factor associated protein D isoform X4 [Nematostella vectensis]